ncbi:unnamed protein product [Parnassius apollo]|uniref:(apollo) hypothetical protein n=1 Tax=Parnassius apollo TaxID=110799 RepID=A0A8S3Y0V6_PARAO|nr:unnamed protein product [Parnassius apollo]
MRQTREEFRAFREELRDIRTLVSKCDARLDKLENMVQTILESQEQYGSQGFKIEILKLESTVNQLQADLNDRDQELLANDVELSGIPEESREKPTHLVLSVVTKFGIHLEKKELVHCMRIKRICHTVVNSRVRLILDFGGFVINRFKVLSK